MAVALSFDRFRSRNFKLLREIRKISSYLLAKNMLASVRWIPSEFNNSDEPSRFFSQEGSKLLTEQIPIPFDKAGPVPGKVPQSSAQAATAQKENSAEQECGAQDGGRSESSPENCFPGGASPCQGVGDPTELSARHDRTDIQFDDSGPAWLAFAHLFKEGTVSIQYKCNHPGAADPEATGTYFSTWRMEFSTRPA
eukprot:s985_g21.t1